MEHDPAHSIAWEVLRPTIVVAGSGIWTEVLARLLFRSGGSPIVVARPEVVLDEPVSIRPAAVVAGSPLPPAELIRIAAMVRERVPVASVIAALGADAPPDLASDLRVVGALAITVGEDLRQLASCVGRAAGLHIRHSQRGILLAPVLLRSGHALHAAIASDVSEGGLGVEGADPSLIHDVAEAQFHLPGAAAPITVSTKLAWIGDRSGTRVRAGIRFMDLDPLDLLAIRTYQGECAETAPDESPS